MSKKTCSRLSKSSEESEPGDSWGFEFGMSWVRALSSILERTVFFQRLVKSNKLHVCFRLVIILHCRILIFLVIAASDLYQISWKLNQKVGIYTLSCCMTFYRFRIIPFDVQILYIGMINFTLKNQSGPVFSRQPDQLGLVLLSPVGSTQYMGQSRTGCGCSCLIWK